MHEVSNLDALRVSKIAVFTDVKIFAFLIGVRDALYLSATSVTAFVELWHWSYNADRSVRGDVRCHRRRNFGEETRRCHCCSEAVARSLWPEALTVGSPLFKGL